MKTIINGFKYDTEAATKKFEKSFPNGSEVGSIYLTIYQNRRGKFFTHSVTIDEKGTVIVENIEPKKATEIKDFLVKINEVDVYEALFGEVEEAYPDELEFDLQEHEYEAGEYALEVGGEISLFNHEEEDNGDLANSEKAETNDDALPASQSSVSSNNSIELLTLIKTHQLKKAVLKNNVKKASMAIMDGAKINSSIISKAILTLNVDLVQLLAYSSPGSLKKTHYNIALRTNPEVYKVLCKVQLPGRDELNKHIANAKKFKYGEGTIIKFIEELSTDEN